MLTLGLKIMGVGLLLFDWVLVYDFIVLCGR